MNEIHDAQITKICRWAETSVTKQARNFVTACAYIFINDVNMHETNNLMILRVQLLHKVTFYNGNFEIPKMASTEIHIQIFA